MEYLVGRGDECQIKIDYPRISTVHCKIADTPEDYLIIEDLDSTNHTYINDAQVRISRYYPTDKLMLADKEIEFNWIKSKMQALFNESKTDFREEFAAMKKLYNDHQQKIRDIKIKYGKKGAIVRALFSLIPAIIGNIPPVNQYKGVSSILSAVSAALVAFFLIYQTNNPKTDEEITQENNSFQLKYKCPKCGKRFGQVHYDIIAADKNCGNTKCDAILA